MIRITVLVAAGLIAAVPLSATVYEFGADGTVTTHDARDYRQRAREAAAADSRPLAARKAAVAEFVQAAAKRHKRLTPELINAVIAVESAFRPEAVSKKGAEGLMQLMPDTAARYEVSDSFDPAENIKGGAHYLDDLLVRYGGSLRLALAAYNAGEPAVDRYGGVPPFPETEGFLAQIGKRLGLDLTLKPVVVEVSQEPAPETGVFDFKTVETPGPKPRRSGPRH